MEQEEKGISLLQFFEIIFGRKIVLLISIIVTLIVGLLFTTLYYNKNKVTYSSDYIYVSDNLAVGEYSNGLSYDYHKLIDLDIYKSIKESDEIFAKLNVDDLYDSSAIKISEEKIQVVGTNEYRVSYSLSTLKKYFPSYAVAKKFIEKLSQYPIEKEKEIIKNLNYNYFLNSYSGANTYEQKIKLLILQKNLINDNYSKLFNLYGNVSVNDSTLKSYKNTFELYFESHDLNDLLNQIAVEGFTLSYSGLNNDLNIEKQALEAQKTQNELKITNLQDQIQVLVDKVGSSNISSINLDSYNARIVELTTQNVDIANEISILDRKIANLNSTDSTYLSKKEQFDNLLDTYYSKLLLFTNEYKAVSNEIEEENTYILYSSSSVITQSGGVSIIIAIAGSIIFGLIIGCVINFCLDHKKFSAKNNEITTKEE